MKKIMLFAAGLLLGAAALCAQDKFYGIKSGHLKYKTQSSGNPNRREVWFDDYGRYQKQLSQTYRDGLGYFCTETLMRDGKTYTNTWFDDDRKDEAWMAEGTSSINYLNPSDLFVRHTQFKEVGSEEVLGKTCNVYTYRLPGLPTTKVWVWEGILMREVVQNDAGSLYYDMLVTEFDENPDLPASTFALPTTVIIVSSSRGIAF